MNLTNKLLLFVVVTFLFATTAKGQEVLHFADYTKLKKSKPIKDSLNNSPEVIFKNRANLLKEIERLDADSMHSLKKDSLKKELNKIAPRKWFTFGTLTKEIDREERKKFWESEPDTVVKHRTTLLSGSFSNNAGSLFTDLIFDHIGLWRISFATSITNAKNDSIKTLEGFMAGGGNAILRTHFPLAGVRSRIRPENLYAVLYFAPRLAANIPALGNSSNKVVWNVDLGVEGQAYVAGDNNLLSIGGRIRGAWVWGSTDFVEPIVKDARTFFYAQASLVFGVKNLMIMVNAPIGISGRGVKDLPASISLGYLY